MWVSCKPDCSGAFSKVGGYAAGEAGIGYKIPQFPLSFAVSYKVQVINTGTKAKEVGNVVDLTHGPAIGLTFIW